MLSRQYTFARIFRLRLTVVGLALLIGISGTISAAQADETRCNQPVSISDDRSCNSAISSARKAILLNDRNSTGRTRRMKQLCRASTKAQKGKKGRVSKKKLISACTNATQVVEAKAFAGILLQTSLGMTREACIPCSL